MLVDKPNMSSKFPKRELLKEGFTPKPKNAVKPPPPPPPPPKKPSAPPAGK